MRVLLLFLLSITSGATFAQDYPTRPVRMIEPFGAGGGPDVIARAVAPKLSELWGQPVTVENQPGAGSTAASALVAKSPADGYTLLVNTSAQAYSAVLVKNLPYDPLKDFIAVAPLTSQPYVLVSGKSSGITTVRELIAAAKVNPGGLKFGSTGIGTGTHLGLVEFNLQAGIEAVHVPPRPGDAITDVIANAVAGRTTYMMAPIQLALVDIRAGRLRALGVTVAATPQASPEETAVRNIVQEEIAAWNSGDAAAYSRHFAADVTFTNIRGEFFTGRQPFIEKHDNLFKGPFHGSTLKQDIVSLKFVRPVVAVVEVLTSVTGIQKLFPGTNTDDKGRLRTRLLKVLVKEGNEWKITAYHNTDVKSGVPVPDPQ